VRSQIVISGVNLTEMGPLAVFKDALCSLASHYGKEYEITALVHNRALFDIPNVAYLEFPDVKSSWIKRLCFEFWLSKGISDRIQPHLWLSMDNVTPNIAAEIQAVYCHNPSAFYRFRVRDLWLDWKFGLFTLFFRYLYAINIGRNDHVIVQQDWIRRRFEHLYPVRNVIVAHPVVDVLTIGNDSARRGAETAYRFFYPAFPRTFKNAEVALTAAALMERNGFHGFELWLTFDASVNRYASGIVRRFSHVRSVRWLGLLPRQQVFARYAEVDCLLFPSKLETWGLPITEFKITGKPILAADLPYAHETVGSYAQAAFFDPEKSENLARLMKAAALGERVFSAVNAETISSPFATNWTELWSLLLSQ
jgi:glycosyltransferase involved in cell wall biosynthesis